MQPKNSSNHNTPTKQIIQKNLAALDAETLLLLHSQGDCYTSDAQNFIRDTLSARNINIVNQKKSRPRVRPFFAGLIIITALVISEIVNQFIKRHYLSYLVIAVGGLYYFSKFSEAYISTKSENTKDKDDEFVRNDGLSEMMVKTARNDINGVREIIFRGGDVNKKSHSGLTAIMYAASNNNINIVKLLLENGADPTIKSNKGRSAISIAENHKFLEIIQIFKQHGFMN